MKLSAITKRNISRIIPFGVIWFILGCLFLWVEYAALGDQENVPDSAIKMSADVLVFALTGITLIGFLVGYIELKILNRLFITNSFLTKLLGKFFIYVVFFLVIILITYPIAASFELNTSVFDERVWDKYLKFFFSITHLSAAIQLGFSLLISLLYTGISQSLGHHVLLSFFTGKYHKPMSETRIFMFADMKSSTTIAEELGHVKYFELLKSYYYHISRAIVKNYGEVYQYVGDEIVISWKLKSGLKNNNCVYCFFEMKQDLLKKKDWYMTKYGFFPDFKAGLHFGEVTTGEIGTLKKEILFTGDVLNTTARIQSLCNTYKTDLLVSKKLMDSLDLKNSFKVQEIGATALKGKTEVITLVTLDMIP